MKEKKRGKIFRIFVFFVCIAMLSMSYPVSSSSVSENEDNQIGVLRPIGDIINEWVPGSGTGYTEVDEEQADETKTYIGTSINGGKDVYEVNSLELGEIEKITVYGRFITDFTDSRFKLLVYNKDTGEFNFSDQIQLRKRGGWETVSQVWEKNPFTKQKWTEEDLDKIGIGICADYCQYSAAVFCTQVYAEVIYTNAIPMTIDDLIDSFEDMNLNWRINWRLKIKLRIAKFLIDRDIDNAATRILERFIHQVERLDGRRIESEDAANLIEGTEQVIEHI